MTEYKFNFIDLFAGVGGFRLALNRLGGRCVFSSEINESATLTYKENFGDDGTHFGDITLNETKSKIPDHFDILAGGFPCQAFSIAGHRKGFEDTRGTLFFDIAQILNEKKPKVVFLENVKNLTSHDHGNTFKTILKTLDELDYDVHYDILNSMTHANIPQNRERVFIVGFRKDLKCKFAFPKKIKLEKTIHHFLEKNVEDKYYYQPNHIYYQELQSTMKSKDTLYQWRRIYVRENKSNVCPTLTANMGAGGHNVPLLLDDKGIRKLTPRECFNFQGFPQDFKFPKNIANSRLYMQAGNSVTTTLIQLIAKNILIALEIIEKTDSPDTFIEQQLSLF